MNINNEEIKHVKDMFNIDVLEIEIISERKINIVKKFIYDYKIDKTGKIYNEIYDYNNINKMILYKSKLLRTYYIEIETKTYIEQFYLKLNQYKRLLPML